MHSKSNTNPEQTSRNEVSVLASFYFLHYCTLGIIFPFSGYFFKEKGYSGTEIGFFLAIFPLAKFIFANFWANRFSESHHRRIFIAVCIFVSSTSLIPLYFFDSRLLTAAVMVIFAFSRAGIIPVMDSMAIAMNDRIPYGRMRLFGSLGFIATSISAGFIMDKFGISSFIFAFMAAGLLSIIPAIMMSFDMELFKPKTAQEKRLTPDLALFFAGLTVYLTTFSFLSNFLNIKVASVGLSQTEAGYMWSIGVVSEIFFFYNQELVLKYVKLKPLIIVSMLLGGVRYLVTGYAQSFTVLFIFSAFHGFSYGTFHTGVMQYIRLRVPERLKLKAQTMYSGVGYGLGTIMGSGISGLVYDSFGIKAVFTSACLFCVTGAFLLYLFIGAKEDHGCKQN